MQRSLAIKTNEMLGKGATKPFPKKTPSEGAVFQELSGLFNCLYIDSMAG